MMSEPLVSIIIPCFNKGIYIEETLQSVFRQTYSNWECVIVDDGSTDDKTLRALRKIDHPAVKVYFNTNRGVSATRNFAISKSQGIYVLPLDADDLLHRDTLKKMVPVLQQNANVKVVSCNVGLIGSASGKMSLPKYRFDLLLARNILVVTCLFRRAEFNQVGGYNENMKRGFEDWDFWLAFLKRGGDVYSINETLFYYRIIRGSRNHSLNRNHFHELREAIYTNHRDVYDLYRFDPYETFEYQLMEQSLEYRLGRMLLKPLRLLLGRKHK